MTAIHPATLLAVAESPSDVPGVLSRPAPDNPGMPFKKL